MKMLSCHGVVLVVLQTFAEGTCSVYKHIKAAETAASIGLLQVLLVAQCSMCIWPVKGQLSFGRFFTPKRRSFFIISFVPFPFFKCFFGRLHTHVLCSIPTALQREYSYCFVERSSALLGREVNPAAVHRHVCA